MAIQDFDADQECAVRHLETSVARICEVLVTIQLHWECLTPVNLLRLTSSLFLFLESRVYLGRITQA